MKKVVIIGSGLSGLACGYYLDKSKFDIKIFESKKTPGGRVKSEKVDGYICDIGFQVLLNNYDEIKKLNLYHKLNLKYFESGASIYQDGKILKLYNPIFHPFKFLFSNFFKIFKLKDLFAITLNFLFKKNTVYEKTSDLMNRYLSTKSRSLFFYPFFKGIFLNKSLSNDSIFFLKIFKKFVFGRASLPQKGMSELPELMIKKSNLSINYNYKLKDIENNKAYFENGKVEDFDIVIFAIPIKVINDILKTNYASKCYSNKTIYVSSPQNKLGKSILLIPDEKYYSNSIQCLTNISKYYSKKNDSLYSISSLKHDIDDKVLLNELSEICNLDKKVCRIVKSYSIPHSLPADFINLKNKEYIFFCGDWKTEPSIDGAIKSGRLIAKEINEEAN